MRVGVIKWTKSGEDKFAPVSFTYEDLGLNEPENPATGSPENNEPKADDSPAPVENAAPALDPAPAELTEPEYLASLDRMSTEALQASRLEWMKPACTENGVVTNAPSVFSRNWPSPMNFKRVLRSNCILQARGLVGARPIIIKRPYTVDPSVKAQNDTVANLGQSEEWANLWKRTI